MYLVAEFVQPLFFIIPVDKTSIVYGVFRKLVNLTSWTNACGTTRCAEIKIFLFHFSQTE